MRSLARSLIYWFRDSRQSRQLILLPVLPALMLIWWRLFGLDAMALAIGPVVASLLPLVGVRRASPTTAPPSRPSSRRACAACTTGSVAPLALLIIAVPSVAVVQVAVAVIIGRIGDLPALLGLSLCILLVCDRRRERVVGAHRGAGGAPRPQPVLGAAGRGDRLDLRLVRGRPRHDRR